MKKAAVSCLMVALFAWSVFSQTVNICGKVTDPAGNPLTHTVVRLGQATQDNGYGPMPYLVTTDANGQYQLGTGTCPPVNVLKESKAAHGGAYPKPVYAGGKVLFSVLPIKAWVKMSMYDLAGRFIRDVMNRTLTRGNYSGSIDTRGISSQYYLLRVTINGATNVLKFRPLSRVQGETVAQNAPEFQASLEKIAVVADTLHATEPGYSIGVTPIDTLAGHYDFVLTKTTTWTGDKASIAAFWGDTSTYPKNGQYIILNRTNGAWPDSKVCWGGAWTPLSTQHIKPIASERFYIYIDPTDSNDGHGNARYFDFLEVGFNGSMFTGNSTRVDGWRLPIAFRLHTSTGIDTIMGDEYETFFQPRQAKFDEYLNEVPKEFTPLAKVNFANIYSAQMMAVNYYNTGGVFANYFGAYQDSVIAHNPGAPGKETAWNVLACAGNLGNSPDYCAAYNRHVGTLPIGNKNLPNWRDNDSASFYQAAPCNYFSRWCHRRSINNYCYGFAYDDDGGWQSFMGIGNVQWIAVAIGW
jgi:hypothetical protein